MDDRHTGLLTSGPCHTVRPHCSGMAGLASARALNRTGARGEAAAGRAARMSRVRAAHARRSPRLSCFQKQLHPATARPHRLCSSATAPHAQHAQVRSPAQRHERAAHVAHADPSPQPQPDDAAAPVASSSATRVHRGAVAGQALRDGDVSCCGLRPLIGAERDTAECMHTERERVHACRETARARQAPSRPPCCPTPSTPNPTRCCPSRPASASSPPRMTSFTPSLTGAPPLAFDRPHKRSPSRACTRKARSSCMHGANALPSSHAALQPVRSATSARRNHMCLPVIRSDRPSHSAHAPPPASMRVPPAAPTVRRRCCRARSARRSSRQVCRRFQPRHHSPVASPTPPAPRTGASNRLTGAPPVLLIPALYLT